MKKILMAMAFAAFAYTSAEAQANKTMIANCGVDEKEVCREYGGNKTCYPSKYAQNYKVCKGENGYYVCCHPEETANTVNNNAEDQNEADKPGDEFVMYQVRDNGVTEKVTCKKAGNRTVCYRNDYGKNDKRQHLYSVRFD